MFGNRHSECLKNKLCAKEGQNSGSFENEIGWKKRDQIAIDLSESQGTGKNL